jgi:hypothetical protein
MPLQKSAAFYGTIGLTLPLLVTLIGCRSRTPPGGGRTIFAVLADLFD